MQTRGYAAQSADTPLGPFQFERREPGGRDVHIEIDYCGICHSDIHFARDEWGITPYPCVPGHEIIGRVVKAGSDATRFREGQRVGVGCFIRSCGRCSSCAEGQQNYCVHGVTMTYGSMDRDGKTPTFGGYSGQIVVDEQFVFDIPDNLDPAGAAPLLCAGITTYSPLRQVGVGPGSEVAVMGLGGLGHMAVKLANSLGGAVTVFSRSPEKEEDARKLGARNFVVTTREGAFESQAGRFDAVVDTISAKHDINGPIGSLKPRGTLILLGVSPETLELSPFPLIIGHRKIMGSLVGGIPETQEMLDHCGKNGIASDVEVIGPEQINDAYERTLRGDVKYRFVIDCASFRS